MLIDPSQHFALETRVRAETPSLRRQLQRI